MSPISNDLGLSLDRLNRVIRNAAAILSKMPGAAESRIVLDDGTKSQPMILNFDHDESGNGEIWLSYWDTNEDYYSITEGGNINRTRLVDLRIVERIKWASRIPDLIDAATAKESDIASKAEATTAAIEQAIANALNR